MASLEICTTRHPHSLESSLDGDGESTCSECRDVMEGLQFNCSSCEYSICGSCASETSSRRSPLWSLKQHAFVYHCGQPYPSSCKCGSCNGYCEKVDSCMCDACAKLKDTTTQARHPHPLALARCRKACSICKSFIDSAFSCALCDYYECHGCFSITGSSSSDTRPIHSHDLVLGESTTASKPLCSVCRQMSLTVYAQCKQCPTYYECLVCCKRHPFQFSTSKAATLVRSETAFLQVNVLNYKAYLAAVQSKMTELTTQSAPGGPPKPDQKAVELEARDDAIRAAKEVERQRQQERELATKLQQASLKAEEEKKMLLVVNTQRAEAERKAQEDARMAVSTAEQARRDGLMEKIVDALRRKRWDLTATCVRVAMEADCDIATWKNKEGKTVLEVAKEIDNNPSRPLRLADTMTAFSDSCDVRPSEWTRQMITEWFSICVPKIDQDDFPNVSYALSRLRPLNFDVLTDGAGVLDGKLAQLSLTSEEVNLVKSEVNYLVAMEQRLVAGRATSPTSTSLVSPMSTTSTSFVGTPTSPESGSGGGVGLEGGFVIPLSNNSIGSTSRSSSAVLLSCIRSSTGESCVAKVFPPIPASEWSRVITFAKGSNTSLPPLSSSSLRFIREHRCLTALAAAPGSTEKQFVVSLYGSTSVTPDVLSRVVSEKTISVFLQTAVPPLSISNAVFPVLILERGELGVEKMFSDLVAAASRPDQRDTALSLLRNNIVRLLDIVYFVNKSGFVWGDCKIDNFVLTKTSLGDTLKAIDFDGAVPVGDTAVGGTPLYLPPERHSAPPIAGEKYPILQSVRHTSRSTFEQDAYAAGVSLLMLLSDKAKSNLMRADQVSRGGGSENHCPLILSLLDDFVVQGQLGHISPHLHNTLKMLLHPIADQRAKVQHVIESGLKKNLSTDTDHSLALANIESKIDTIHHTVNDIKRIVSEIAAKLTDVLDCIAQSNTASFPRVVYFEEIKTFKSRLPFADTTYRVHLSCDGLWALPAIGAADEDVMISTKRDHPGFVLKVPSKLYQKVLPVLAIATKVLAVAIKVAAVIAPTGALGMLGSHLGDSLSQIANVAIDNLKDLDTDGLDNFQERVEALAADANPSFDPKVVNTKKSMEVVGEAYNQLFNILESTQKTDPDNCWNEAKLRTADLVKVWFMPGNAKSNYQARYIWMCQERFEVAVKKYPSHFRATNPAKAK